MLRTVHLNSPQRLMGKCTDQSYEYVRFNVISIGPVPARYVRQSQICPQLDMSDKNDKKNALYVRQSQMCPTQSKQKSHDMSDKCV